jgi:hypothetical protein
MSKKENITLGALMLKKVFEIEDGSLDVMGLGDEKLEELIKALMDFSSSMKSNAQRTDSVLVKIMRRILARKYDLKEGDIVTRKDGKEYFFRGFVVQCYDWPMLKRGNLPKIRCQIVKKDGTAGVNMANLYGWDEWKKK